MIESGFVNVDGGRLYYEAAGAGPTVVFIHGFALDVRMWDHQWEVFARRYRVIRYDVRGFGQSSKPSAETFSHLEDLHMLLQHLAAAPAHLVGLSMGGGLALDFALMYPTQVRSLVLADSTLGGFDWKKDWGEPFRAAKAAGLEAAKAAWLNDELFAPANTRPAVAAQLQTITETYSGQHWLNTVHTRGLEKPAIEQLETLAMPVCVVVGEHDLPDFHAIAEILAKCAQRASQTVLPGVGHMANMEAPEAFNHVVLEFLARIET